LPGDVFLLTMESSQEFRQGILEARYRNGTLPGKSTGSRRERMTGRQRGERVIIAGCFLLGLCLSGFTGFVLGRKAPAKETGETKYPAVDIVATSETGEKIDAAFSDLRAGNPKKALLEFQDAQSAQPGLYGIDFLVGYAAYFAGEPTLARESFQTAVGKKELEEEAGAILALIDASKDAAATGGATIADPVASAESALQHYASRRPLDPRGYYFCAEMLRSKGSYRTSAELMARALARTDPYLDPRLIEAKMTLTRLQNIPRGRCPRSPR